MSAIDQSLSAHLERDHDDEQIYDRILDKVEALRSGCAVEGITINTVIECVFMEDDALEMALIGHWCEAAPSGHKCLSELMDDMAYKLIKEKIS